VPAPLPLGPLDLIEAITKIGSCVSHSANTWHALYMIAIHGGKTKIDKLVMLPQQLYRIVDKPIDGHIL